MSERSQLIKQLKRAAALPAEESLPQLVQFSRSPEFHPLREALGRVINRLVADIPKVRLLGACTLDYLAPILAADLFSRNIQVQVAVGGYDQILQDLQQQEEKYAVLVPWRLEIADPSAELMFWKMCWDVARKKGIRLIQVSYDWVRSDTLGQQCDNVDAVVNLNRQLREELPDGHYFLDLSRVSSGYGKQRFYDNRSYFWTKQPFSDEGLQVFSESLVAALRAVITGPKKVVVLDLDNTLWGGVVGEVGGQNVGLLGAEGEAFRAFQKHLKMLSERGILLAIASKNEESVALQAIAENPNMILKPDDFVATQIHWEPKSQSLIRISEELRLGLDSFVFFDDNPRERAEVARALPEVAVVDTSANPVNYIDELVNGRYFETLEVTELDRSRTLQYKAEAQRTKAKETVGDYFAYLEMKADIQPFSLENQARIVQLFARTNQFNVTTRRHGPDQLKGFAEVNDVYLCCLSLTDRFGELGIISAMLALPDDENVFRIDSWVMSCRALQRTVEYYFFHHMVEHAKSRGYQTLRGEYLPTAKNKPVEQLYPKLGFQQTTTGVFELALRDYKPQPNHVS